ncbi:hypothetical protein ACVI1L_000684 [Bradyrhizobium sp. USDA 4516]
MKAFEFDHRLIGSYARFSRSFSTIRSDDLKSEVDRKYDAGRFWPDALLSLNPQYLRGPTVDALVASGDLDEATGKIFRFGATPLQFHRHQAQSIAKARAGQSYVVTTGTGSGKSLCFFVPVVDAIVRARKAGRPRRTSAIIVSAAPFILKILGDAAKTPGPLISSLFYFCCRNIRRFVVRVTVADQWGVFRKPGFFPAELDAEPL